ncbi:MAG: hypothetical protein AVDCRST_MAG80-430 [uncultured Rubrobacteraceae bacterium]|uniref:LysR substrate-binding domain-containing protein n=1 Tax=uncultured Rubrobacteraceae bacterium TaxID=349277 RepID=A0A6J4PXP2_9ACTN|nr:MAG: hypothetical protein AVDCRST_MAG80-430 [uncultured Rubrobacteraceae bacterium]
MRDPIDEALEARGLRRRVVAAAPTIAAALHLIRQSDVIVAVPEHICQPMVRTFGLRTLPIPLDLLSVPVIQAWHQRYDGDKAHTWLRTQIREMLQTVARPGS